MYKETELVFSQEICEVIAVLYLFSIYLQDVTVCQQWKLIQHGGIIETTTENVLSP
jgi:hypothetical protein